MSSPSTKRRRRLFHQLFKSVPPSENLLQVYRCALQKDILVQGHMYISEHHVCFRANIFGWVTRDTYAKKVQQIVLPFNDIGAIKKRHTAKVIPNGIEIVSRWATHVFASFMARDRVSLLLTELWLKHHCQQLQHQPYNGRTPTTNPSRRGITIVTPPAMRRISPEVDTPLSNNCVGWIPPAPSSDDDNVNAIDPGSTCVMALAVVLILTHTYTAYYLFRILRQLSFF